MSDVSTTVFHELGIPNEPYSEEEASTIIAELFEALDAVTPSRSAPAAKTVLIDFFGTANSGKTRTTEHIERIFRRHRCNVFCPPETAEIPEIRNRSTGNLLIFQARHVTGVQDYVLNLAHNRDYHVAIMSRGLIDMLYWYARWVREGKCSEKHRHSVREAIYEILRHDLVDAFFFFTCSPEESLRREYEGSPTRREGSNMNEKTLGEALGLYQEVLAHVAEHVPGLPLFTIDTTHLGIYEVSLDVLRYLLPTLCSRFHVAGSRILTKSLTLLRKEASRRHFIEEQLKLRGHPLQETIRNTGWVEWAEFGTVEQEDFYLSLGDVATPIPDPLGENIRIRRQGDLWLLYVKGRARDHIFSHRTPLLVAITETEAREVLARFPVMRRLKKVRRHFLHEKDISDSRFALHLDAIEGLGEFTEIRVLGVPGTTHTATLLTCATELGFNPSDIIEGTYITLPTLS